MPGPDPSSTVGEPTLGDQREPAATIDFALALSGGGYRAMLFHAGALWRLNEAGLLGKLNRISSVSGGSITAGVLALAWTKLGWRDGRATELRRELLAPLHGLASTTVDYPSIVLGTVFGTVGKRVAAAYDRRLFHGATLQDLPADADGPRFVINATNVQTGTLFRFSRPYAADYQVGRIENPRFPLSLVVAASSAFPPFLSPVFVPLDPGALKPYADSTVHGSAYTIRLALTDGGVYDNLGLETVGKQARTIFVSDGGARYQPEPNPSRWWLGHAYRVLMTIDNQVRALRKRDLLQAFKGESREKKQGAFWAVWGDADRYQLHPSLQYRPGQEPELARVKTRLGSLPVKVQQRLVNWGYAISDASLRQNYDPELSAPEGYPYPGVMP